MKKKTRKKLFPILVVIAIASMLTYKEISESKAKKNIEKEKTKIIVPKVKENIISKSIFKDYYKIAQDVLDKMSLEEKVGQLFLVRYNKADIESFSKYFPGGYVLFAKDFENHTKESMRAELNYDQEQNKYPLLIAVDEEGGYVTRVSRFKNFRNERFKSPKAYYEEGNLNLLEQSETEKANLLKELGINLNLAPVADVSTNPEDFIYNRTFGYDATKTSELITKMVEFANKNEINSCLKHFPGYGNNVDTHTGIAVDNRSYEEFKENDFKPFEAGIKAGAPSILVSHNIITALDDKHPASLSQKVIDELRKTLNFTGVIMTDDLAMDAVKSYVASGKAATLAINAGNDMIITSDFINMYNEVLNSVKNKELEEQKINDAVLRIIAWKYSSKLFT